MENFTIAQRQEIYEHLLTLETPDLLAALIANRTDKKFIDSNWLDKSDLASWIVESFDWTETPEDFDFWYGMQDSVFMDYYFMGFDTELDEDKPPINIEIVPFHAVKITDDLTIPQPTRDGESFQEWWNKIKIQIGRIFYKV